MAWKCKHCGKVNQKESTIQENVKMIDVLYKALKKAGKPISEEALVLWKQVKIKLKEAEHESSLVLRNRG